MKNYRKMSRIYRILISFLLLVSMYSCGLKEDSSPISTPDNYFRNFTECQSVVNGCYIPIKSIYTYPYFLATECCADLMYCASGTFDAQLDISPVKPRFGATVWQYSYLGIQRCNFAVAGLEACKKITEEEKIELLCEAKALRAFYYWTLTSFFGDVPFYFDDVADNATLERISKLPRMDANLTREKCIEDLKAIAPLAPQTRTSDNKGARVGAAMAWMLIAKMASWNKEWDTVIEACTALEAIYGDLASYDLAENTWFRNKNTPESVFEVQHEYVEGGLVYTSNVACICTPTRKGGAIYDGIEILELGSQSTTWSSARPNVYFCQGLQPRKSADTRKENNYAWEYDGQTFASLVNATRPWMGPKFWCPGMRTSQDSNNYKVFRYADAILLKAEALCCKGEYSQSVEYVNITRRRAGLSDYVFRTYERLYEEIRNESAREKFGEFQRKFDLVRWGIWYTAVMENSDYSTLINNMLPCHRYYPIPDKQVVYSEYNLDNKEYAAYGL